MNVYSIDSYLFILDYSSRTRVFLSLIRKLPSDLLQIRLQSIPFIAGGLGKCILPLLFQIVQILQILVDVVVVFLLVQLYQVVLRTQMLDILLLDLQLLLNGLNLKLQQFLVLLNLRQLFWGVIIIPLLPRNNRFLPWIKFAFKNIVKFILRNLTIVVFVKVF